MCISNRELKRHLQSSHIPHSVYSQGISNRELKLCLVFAVASRRLQRGISNRELKQFIKSLAVNDAVADVASQIENWNISVACYRRCAMARRVFGKQASQIENWNICVAYTPPVRPIVRISYRELKLGARPRRRPTPCTSRISNRELKLTDNGGLSIS